MSEDYCLLTNDLPLWFSILDNIPDFLLPVLHRLVCDYIYPCEHAISNTIQYPPWRYYTSAPKKLNVYSTRWLYGRMGNIIHWKNTEIIIYQGTFDTCTHWSLIQRYPTTPKEETSAQLVSFFKQDTTPTWFIIDRNYFISMSVMAKSSRPYFLIWMPEPNEHSLSFRELIEKSFTNPYTSEEHPTTDPFVPCNDAAIMATQSLQPLIGSNPFHHSN